MTAHWFQRIMECGIYVILCYVLMSKCKTGNMKFRQPALHSSFAILKKTTSQCYLIGSFALWYWCQLQVISFAFWHNFCSFEVLGIHHLEEIFCPAYIGWVVHKDDGRPKESRPCNSGKNLYLKGFLLHFAMLPSTHWLHFFAMSETHLRFKPLPNLQFEF